jgi:hypothetical protein
MIGDFQLALIGIAVLIIVCVVIFNRVQEKRYRDHADRAFRSDHPDVLFDAHDATAKPARLEPSLGDLPTPDDDVVLDEISSPQALAPHGNRAGIHPDIDTVALVLADTPVANDALQDFMQRAQRFSRPVIWEGLVDGIWVVLAPETDAQGDTRGVDMRELRVALQLADRRGAVDHEEIRRFQDLAQELAGAVSAVSQCEPADQAAARALALDAFCADNDIEIAVNVTGKNGATFAPTKVRGLAESSGMVCVPSGEYVFATHDRDVLFALRNMDASQPAGIGRGGAYLAGLTFALDLPRVHDGAAALKRMLALAAQFANVLGGEVVDDNKRPLTENGLAIIARTVDEIANKMVERGIAPGSPAAKRLFS